MCKIDGRKAKVIDAGKRFSTYRDFALKYGYPDAYAENHRLDTRNGLDAGDEVTLLVSGPHMDGYGGKTLWIVETAKGDRYIIGEDGLETVEEPLSSRPETDQTAEIIANLAARLTALESEVATLKAPTVKAESIAEGIAKLAGGERKAAPLTRDDVIERAKADVAELKETDELKRTAYFYPAKKDSTIRYVCNVEFVVNKEKRTVVALLRWRYDNAVKSVGKSRCAPDDVFNVHIGKALSLRRALGLYIPDEYVNSPKPTEVRVGDIVRYSTRYPRLLVTESKTDIFANPPVVSLNFLRTTIPGIRIVDDSRECEAEEVSE